MYEVQKFKNSFVRLVRNRMLGTQRVGYWLMNSSRSIKKKSILNLIPYTYLFMYICSSKQSC